MGVGEAGLRLDVFLGGRPEVGTRAAAQRLIDAGAVTVDGVARPKRHRVAAGDLITIALDPGAAQAVDAGPVPFSLAYEDEHVLVVDKPAGVVVHPGAGTKGPTLVDALAGLAAGGDPERPGIVHRLDRDTSGLMLVARSQASYESLRDQIAGRQVVREYLALVEGRPDADSGTIDAPLGRDRARRTRMSTATDRPRDARTHFEVAEELPGTTLLRVRLETGRTHQIRAHLEAIGFPVCGDPVYGGRASGRRLGLARQFLHSSLVRFEHPGTGEETACESKLPADLRRAYDAAKREPVSGGPDGG